MRESSELAGAQRASLLLAYSSFTSLLYPTVVGGTLLLHCAPRVSAGELHCHRRLLPPPLPDAALPDACDTRAWLLQNKQTQSGDRKYPAHR